MLRHRHDVTGQSGQSHCPSRGDRKRLLAGRSEVSERPSVRLDIVHQEPAFATDPTTAEYYDRRASEYDEWYTGQGLFAERDRPGWEDEVSQLVGLVASL